MTKLPAVPRPDRQDILEVLGLLFDAAQSDAALMLLDSYDPAGRWPDRDRVQMATLVLSEGDLGKLRQFVDYAQRDYRDVLYWCEYTKPGRALLDAVTRRRREMQGR